MSSLIPVRNGRQRLKVQLNGTNPSWIAGPSINLPAHAFASAAITPDGNDIVVVGGMTSDCATDSLTHTLSLKGNGTWVDANPSGLVRRRGGGMGVLNDYSAHGDLMLVGGVADQYSCGASTPARIGKRKADKVATYTTTFPASNTLSLPLGATSVIATHDLPGNLTGSTLAVSDFAMTTSADGNKMYLLSGQSSSGALVTLDNIGVYSQSTGWVNQKVGGNIPVGRVGASLVAHPTLDLLVLHGGARDDRGTDLSTSLLALLNTTSWQWTIPSNLQLPQSSAVSYHSAIMTPTGVMIAAFGLSGTGTPSSNVYFLDMRDPTESTWSWKSAWKSDMLQAYVQPSTGSTATGGSGAAPVSAAMGAPSSKKLASIVAPVVIISVIALPFLVYFIRRRMRIAKKRRMARHFSFSSQEDGGDFNSPLSGKSRKKSTSQYPFGGPDANEKESTSLLADLRHNVTGLVDRIRGRSSSDDMREINSRKGRYNEKSMKWEEIDFGLGEIDSRRGSANPMTGFEPSSRRSSFSATGSPPGARYVDSVPMPVPLPMASGIQYSGQTYNLPSSATDMPAPLLVTISSDSPRVGTPQWDGQQPLIPSLVVMPPTVPPTPAVPGEGMPEPVFPVMQPSAPAPAAAPVDQGLDWNLLQQELENRPAFRSISPTSPLRSHQASHQTPITPPRVNTNVHFAPNPFSDRHAAASSPRSASPSSPAPALPPLDFDSPRQTTTIVHVNPKTGRRTSETVVLPQTPPGQRSTQMGSPRSVSSPMAGRQIAGGSGERRGSVPTYYTAPSSPASPTGSPAVRYDTGARRGSIPQLQLMGSPMGRTGSGQGGERRGSQLRVMNLTEDDAGEEGRAI